MLSRAIFRMTAPTTVIFEGSRMMKCYVTITGLNHYYGTAPFQVGQKLQLIKEPTNAYDREAIRAELPGLGRVGYVANSVHTVVGECLSAGRLYDKIGDTATGKVKYVLGSAVVCKVKAGKDSSEVPADTVHPAGSEGKAG